MIDALLDIFSGPWLLLREFLDAGGWVVNWILVAALVMWTIALERLWYLWRIYPVQRQACIEEWRGRGEHRSWAAQRVRQALISQLRLGLESGLPLIKVMVPMSPLLGLLGTVIGMLQVFDAMTTTRNADTRAMADGISHAMIATMAGLVVSLIALFFVNLFQTRVRRETAQLQELLGAP